MCESRRCSGAVVALLERSLNERSLEAEADLVVRQRGSE